MDYWMTSNRNMAKISTLDQMIGKLECMIEFHQTTTPEELLNFIQETIAEQEKWFDERFPECAETKQKSGKE